VLILEMPHFERGNLCKTLTKSFITIAYHGKKKKETRCLKK
jgi:hypothetical protein